MAEPTYSVPRICVYRQAMIELCKYYVKVAEKISSNPSVIDEVWLPSTARDKESFVIGMTATILTIANNIALNIEAVDKEVPTNKSCSRLSTTPN